MNAREILEATKARVSTYLEADTLPIVVAVADPKETLIGISIQRSYPLTMIERSYGIPFGRFRSDAVQLLSDIDELHGYKWSIETHEAVFSADAATEVRLQQRRQRRVSIKLSTGLGNVLQNLRSVAYVDRTPYMVVGERPDHPPPYACLVEYASPEAREIGVELLLFNELGGCQKVDKATYTDSPVVATSQTTPKYEDQIRWAVSGYPLVLNHRATELELTTRNVSDLRHIWRLPKLERSLVGHLKDVSDMPNPENIEFYFGFDEIRERRNFVLATRSEMLTIPMDMPMTQEWVETMCNVCRISEDKLRHAPRFDATRRAFVFTDDDVRADFIKAGYQAVARKQDVTTKGQFYVDNDRNELSVILLPAIYPHHIVGIDANRNVVNISICGLSGRSGITIDDAKALCVDIGLSDALIFDNGNDVFARYEGKNPIRHKKNDRQTRLTAALHFAELLDPGPSGLCEVQSGEREVKKTL